MFYECVCQNGAMMSGSNTDGTLTCIGRMQYILPNLLKLIDFNLSRR